MTTMGEPMTPVASFKDLARRMMYIHDPDNVCAFLLNYRGFEVPGADLCTSWVDEFGKVCAKENADEFRRAVKKKTSERMLDFLEIWINKYEPNFTGKEIDKINEVLKEWTEPAICNKFKLLLVKGDSRRKGSASSPSRDKIELVPGMDEPLPPAKLESFKFDLMDQFPPSQIAKQLTLYEWEMFHRIKPEEFLNQAWAKRDKFTAAPNINLLIEQFNKVSFWVAVEILTTPSPKYQTRLLRKFISLAYSCIEHNNYNTALEILAGLNHGAVQRLKGIWEKLPEREDQLYKEMDNLMQPRNNFRIYRKDLASKTLPAFPQISLICRDFTYIYDGNPKYNADGSINFDLPLLTYERVKEIEKYQSVEYDFPKNEKILAYFPYLAKFDDYDEDDLHALSLEAQPSMWSGTQLPATESESYSDTPGDSESSDTASSESGSSRYLKGMASPGMHGNGFLPAKKPRSHSIDRSDRSDRSDPATDSEDGGSFGSFIAGSELSSSRKGKKKTRKSKPGDGSEDTSTPRSDSGEKELSPRKPRKKKPVHKAKGALVCQTVKVPEKFLSTFASSEVLVERFFGQVAQSTTRGTLAIGRKRYLLVRVSSLAVDFSSSISNTFTFSNKVKGDEFFRKLLFNFGQLTAKSDARTLARAAKLQTPAQMFSAGPIYQSYAGLGFCEVLPENQVLPTSIADPDKFVFVINNHVSCEATSWKAAGRTHTHPTCYMLNGYISGWASRCFGVPLIGVEIQCTTKGDEVCRTLLCSPDRAKNLVKEYMSLNGYPDEQAVKVKIPSLLTPQDAELYATARRDMNEKQRKTFKPQKLLNTSKISKEELDDKESKLQKLERKSMHYFGKVYSERRYNQREGTVKVGDESYIFVRGKAISKGFVELVQQMFPAQEIGKGLDFAFDFLFDLADSIGKSDYNYGVAKIIAKGRTHPLKRLIGLKKAFGSLGWGAVKFDFRTANLVYSPEHFFLRFILDDSFESEIWLKAKQKQKETEEAKKEVAELAEQMVKEKGITLEEAYRKLDKANKGTAAVKRRKGSWMLVGEDTDENRVTLVVNEVGKSPACVMAAGYANGYIRECFQNKEAADRDLDLVAVEVACRVTGHPTCEFLVCSKNMVQSTVKTYLKEKKEQAFLPNIKYYNVMRKKDAKK